MALIHRLIRRGFDQARELMLTSGATTRATALTEYVGFHLDGLHAHHSSEDELIWPVLRQRANLSDGLITRMEEQHAGVQDAVDSARRELAAWAAAPTAAGAESLAAILGTIVDRLTQHLAEEERDVVPLIAVHITQEEWDRLGKVAFSKFTPKQRLTAMGELLEAAHPAEAARMLAGLPAPVRVIWRLFGRRKYQRFMNSVRGTRAAG
jgi:hemerythrin-like domain-containing protein